jgi:hypothetical protein
LCIINFRDFKARLPLFHAPLKLIEDASVRYTMRGFACPPSNNDSPWG